MLPEDFVVVATANGAAPKVWFGMAANVSAGFPGLTVKLAVAVAAL
jgi:hypothetical protein